MEYIIGIDAGGTKTSFICFDNEGLPIKQVVLPSCHIFQKKEEEIVQTLSAGIRECLADIPNEEMDSVKVSIGMAGFGSDKILQQRITRICQQACYPYECIVTNDAETALLGALNGEDGVLVIVGTGSMALAKHGQSLHRSGGFGYHLGDEGSAYWLVKQLLNIFTKQADGRLPRTTLYDCVMNELKLITPYDIARYVLEVLENDRTKIAGLAPIYEMLVDLQDPYVEKIIEQAATELAVMVNTVAKVFDNRLHPVALQGSVWKLKSLKKLFESKLDGNLYVVESKRSAEYGAYLKLLSIEREK